MEHYYIKTNRTFTTVRKYSWFLTVLVAVGGLWVPKLGLLVILIMAGLITTSFFSGRLWCGNFCPHGSLFDRIIMPISRNKKIPKQLKSKLAVIGFFAFFTFSFSRKVLRVIQLWGTMAFLDRLGFVFVTTYLMVMIVGGLMAILVNSRAWCQFCPMGSLQKISHSLGKAVGVAPKTERKVTISNKDMCHTCGKCARVCPFQLKPYLDFSGNNQFDDSNCIKCATCVENCPAGILSIGTQKKAVQLLTSTPAPGYENRQTIHAKIADIKALKDETWEFTFNFVTPEIVDYKAGQFITLKIEDEPLSFRAYSISSYNEDSRSLKVIIKKVENGYGTGIIFSRFKVGDMVELEGPLGDELVPSPEAEKLVFVANGIGITPFIALVKDVLLNKPNLKSVKLIYGERYETEFLYHDYFKAFADAYPQFEYLPVVSRPKGIEYRKGRVTDVLKDSKLDLEGVKVYMCGSKRMVEDSVSILMSRGVSVSEIFYESEDRIKLPAA
ncbi:Ferredoxin-NADP reductase [Acidaminobacter hydrogenoformans DSM 2784]|uniref:Ferredoxin-NADP reductase n=2 Tax=Acidaminobacter TaxID=65402 RepID=A0A1G5S2N4_9FIRM|nr:Ferredoxin-NADP reductase [Acidaminobacter hydrogenoformans DSM 2784]